MLVLHRTRNPFLSSAWTAHSSTASIDGDENGLSTGDGDVDNIRGRIEDAYHDEIEGQAPSFQPEQRGRNGSGDRGMLVQPSRLHNEGNEWGEQS